MKVRFIKQPGGIHPTQDELLDKISDFFGQNPPIPSEERNKMDFCAVLNGTYYKNTKIDGSKNDMD